MSVGVEFDFSRWLAARRGAMEQSAREGAAYAFAGERKFRRTLAMARPVTMALEATTRLWRDVARTELLGTAVKVTDQQYPRVWAAAKAAGEALHVRVPVVFAAPSSSIKVKVLGTEDSPHLIVSLELLILARDRRCAGGGGSTRSTSGDCAIVCSAGVVFVVMSLSFAHPHRNARAKSLLAPRSRRRVLQAAGQACAHRGRSSSAGCCVQ